MWLGHRKASFYKMVYRRSQVHSITPEMLSTLESSPSLPKAHTESFPFLFGKAKEPIMGEEKLLKVEKASDKIGKLSIQTRRLLFEGIHRKA